MFHKLRNVCLFFLLVVIVFPLDAQEKQQLDSAVQSEITILIVPYNRFKFYTEFSLNEIAEYNEIETSKVYDLFQNSLLGSFINANCSTVHFKIIDDVNSAYLARRVSYSLSRKPNYYASDLTRLNKEDLKRILKGFDADYVMFINWYHIKKDAASSMAFQRTMSPFSLHFVDYDIYNSDKELLFWKSEYKFHQNVTEKALNTKGLNISGLMTSFNKFALEICSEFEDKK